MYLSAAIGQTVQEECVTSVGLKKRKRKITCITFLYLILDGTGVAMPSFTLEEPRGQLGSLLLPSLCYWRMVVSVSALPQSANSIAHPSYNFTSALLECS